MVVGHQSEGPLQTFGTPVPQPVDPPDGGTVLEVEMSHRINGVPLALLQDQVPVWDRDGSVGLRD